MNWFRWYYGTYSDPKFAVVAKRCGQPRHIVLAVWAALLETAGNAVKRGDVSSFDPETIGLALDLEADVVTSVFTAFMAKELVTEDRQVAAWEKRQHYDYSTDRVREYRARKTGKQEEGEPCSPADETKRNDVKRSETQETPDQIRSDTDKKPKRRVVAYSDEFERFWRTYPPLEGNPKEPAFAEFQKAIADSVMPETIIDAARRYAAASSKTGAAKVAHARTWLHQKRWNDWADAPKAGPGPAPASKSDYEQWRDLLARYKPGAYWPSTRGARPESGYCDAPADLLTEWRQRNERAA